MPALSAFAPGPAVASAPGFRAGAVPRGGGAAVGSVAVNHADAVVHMAALAGGRAFAATAPMCRRDIGSDLERQGQNDEQDSHDAPHRRTEFTKVNEGSC